MRPQLTFRESEVVALVIRGLSNRQIAKELGITFGTVKVHVHNILVKLQVEDRYKLAVTILKQTGDSHDTNSKRKHKHKHKIRRRPAT